MIYTLSIYYGHTNVDTLGVFSLEVFGNNDWQEITPNKNSRMFYQGIYHMILSNTKKNDTLQKTTKNSSTLSNIKYIHFI